jgi:hypothetical protein
MPGKSSDEVDVATELRHLRELVAALDRRVAHNDRRGEGAIASDAADLKKNALRRIALLDGSAERNRS